MDSRENGLLNSAPDVGVAFHAPENTFFFLDGIEDLSPETGAGHIRWARHGRKTRMSFNQMSLPFEPVLAWEFPDEYGRDKNLPFDVSFISENALRIRMSAESVLPVRDKPSVMLELFRKFSGDEKNQPMKRYTKVAPEGCGYHATP